MFGLGLPSVDGSPGDVNGLGEECLGPPVLTLMGVRIGGGRVDGLTRCSVSREDCILSCFWRVTGREMGPEVE